MKFSTSAILAMAVAFAQPSLQGDCTYHPSGNNRVFTYTSDPKQTDPCPGYKTALAHCHASVTCNWSEAGLAATLVLTTTTCTDEDLREAVSDPRLGCTNGK